MQTHHKHGIHLNLIKLTLKYPLQNPSTILKNVFQKR